MFLFVPLINAISWGLGILLFYLSFDRISEFLGTGKTLHGLIGKTHGNKARVVASYLTILSFVGFIVAELWFGSRVLLAIFPTNDWIYISALVFILVVSGYLFKGGQNSSIKTDQLQLMFSYIGIFGILVYLLFISFRAKLEFPGALNWGLLLLIGFAIAISIIRKFKYANIQSLSSRLLNIVVTVLFMAIVASSIAILYTNGSKFALSNFVNLEGFGIAGLLSLIILPLSFQFVDLTNWQRILSVGSIKKNGLNSEIKKGLINFSIESPFTWILFIVFGLLVTTFYGNLTFEDVLVDFPKQMIGTGNYIDRIIGYTFIVSIISIMLSTIDSFIMGIAFTYTYDIDIESKKLLDNGSDVNNVELKVILRKGKVFGFGTVIFAFGLFIVFDRFVSGGGEMFINLLLTFYTASLSFLPIVLGMIFLKKRPSENWAIASMFLASILSIGLGVYSVLDDPTYAWYPIMVCVVISFTVYSLGLVLRKNAI